MAQVAADTGRLNPDEVESAMDGSGVPLIELFLRKGERPGGKLRRKLVAVRGSPVEGESSLGQQLAASLEAMHGDSGAVLNVRWPVLESCHGGTRRRGLMVTYCG